MDNPCRAATAAPNAQPPLARRIQENPSLSQISTFQPRPPPRVIRRQSLSGGLRRLAAAADMWIIDPDRPRQAPAPRHLSTTP
ncbi:MAG TPA: hypothetical protein PLG70_08745, partial [Ottowia sp.]|nr:hypothetical protein [Ottowia sp.]